MLAQGDKTKWPYFFRMPVVEFLNTLCFDIDQKEYAKNASKRG